LTGSPEKTRRRLAACGDHQQEHVQEEHEGKAGRKQTRDPVAQPLTALKP
jgi:hypothetical protein